MPTYSYACADCGHKFDIYQSFSEDSLTTCPECQGRLRKVFNSVGVVFKGSGFYRTDSRAESRAQSKSDKPSSAKGSGDSTTSSKTSGSSSSSSKSKSSTTPSA